MKFLELANPHNQFLLKILFYHTNQLHLVCQFQNNVDSTDNVANYEVLKFSSGGDPVTTDNFTGSIDTSFTFIF